MNDIEKTQIKKEIIEEILNLMPEVIGNLMAEHAENTKLRKEFYDKHKEFKEHTDVVTSIVQDIENKKLGQKYSDILEQAVPRIEEQIRIKGKLNLDSVGKIKNLDKTVDLNEDHGEL